MIGTILIYILLAVFCFFPIVIWAYSFSYVDDNPLNKKRFLIWILGWILSVFPILYMENIINFFSFDYFNVFYYVSKITNFISSLEFSLSLGLFLLLIASFSFLLWWFIWKKRELIKIYFKNIIVFLLFVFALWILMFFLNIIFNQFNFTLAESISFWNIVFDTLKLVIFYYIIVAFIEEAAKHFNFLQSSVLYIKSVKDWVLYAIFVALWFSFIENILYLYNYYTVYWAWYELVKLFFFRSCFSIIVHILSSSIVAYYFSKALILYRDRDLSFSYLKIFIYGLSIWIILHLIFDVFLTLWFMSIIFVYFVWGYLYVSSIFYRD